MRRELNLCYIAFFYARFGLCCLNDYQRLVKNGWRLCNRDDFKRAWGTHDSLSCESFLWLGESEVARGHIHLLLEDDGEFAAVATIRIEIAPFEYMYPSTDDLHIPHYGVLRFLRAGTQDRDVVIVLTRL